MHCIERCDAISESNAPEPRPKNTILKYNGLKSLEQFKGPGWEGAGNEPCVTKSDKNFVFNYRSNFKFYFNLLIGISSNYLLNTYLESSKRIVISFDVLISLFETLSKDDDKKDIREIQ